MDLSILCNHSESGSPYWTLFSLHALVLTNTAHITSNTSPNSEEPILVINQLWGEISWFTSQFLGAPALDTIVVQKQLTSEDISPKC